MKNTKLFVRVLVCLLSLCLLAGVFAACTGKEEDPKKTGGATGEKTTGLPTDEKGFILDNVPQLNFDRTFRVLGWGGGYVTQYCGAEESSDAVHPIIWERNEIVQDRLGIEYEWNTALKGDWGARNGFYQELEAQSKGGNSYDAVVCYNLVPGLVVSKGMAANLAGTKYLDLTGPWWPESLLKDTYINNTIYSVAESNDYGLLKNIMAMFFNNKMLEDKKIESPYELVAKNEWTLTKLGELIKDTYADDGDGKVEKDEDIFGFCGATTAKLDCWFFALGFRYTKIDGNEIESLLDQAYLGDYVSAMQTFLAPDDACNADSTQNKMFKEERAYFYSSGLFTTNNIKDAELEIDYGVVPLPKLTSDQESYYTMVHNTYDAWVVPFDCKDPDETSAVLEVSASEAYRSIGPEYFDKYVKVRFAPDDRLAAMYDLCRETIVFDFLYQYKSAFTGGILPDQIKGPINNPDTQQWSTVWDANHESWEQGLATFAGYYDVNIK